LRPGKKHADYSRLTFTLLLLITGPGCIASNSELIQVRREIEAVRSKSDANSGKITELNAGFNSRVSQRE
jgi:hypothetical protein